MRQILFILFSFFLIAISYGQNYSVSGKVVDAGDGQPLPFVNIVVNDSRLGGTTDIDGKFSFRSHKEINFLQLSYVGYEPFVYEVGDKKKNIVIKLKGTEYELPEIIVLPGINPAHRIIDNCIKNRKINDPEKLSAFSYTSYDKMIFTFELDSLPKSLTSMDSAAMDTTETFRQYLEKRHIFMMETVSERKFMAPDRNNEKVIATKIAGFKDPIFVFLLSQIQSTSFYKEKISISDKNYINPISPGSTRKYLFLLQDTLYTARGDSIFIISYRPRINTNFDGLKGRISINSFNWAIQNVIAEPAGKEKGISMKVEQMYELIDEKQWFPVQLNTEVILNNVMVTDTTVSIGVGESSKKKKNADSLSMEVDTTKNKLMSLTFGRGKSYIRDINLNPGLRNRDMNYLTVDVDPEASHRDDNFWKGYRIDSLDSKEKETYSFIDSLSKAENLEMKIKILETLMTGKIPWGHIDLDMNRFFRYNSYEGFSLGLGLHTNDRLSQAFKFGGYVRYGFKDFTWKYGGDADVVIHRNSDLKLGVAYMKDVTETGGTSFFDDDERLLNPDYFRDMFVLKMDNTEMAKIGLGFRTMKWMHLNLGFSKSHKQITDGYKYSIGNEDVNVYFNEFDFTEVQLGFRYAFREKFIRNMQKKISLGTKYPILWFQYTRGLKGVLDGDFDYNRYDLKIEKSFYTNYWGKTSLKLAAGFVDADIPQTNLYYGNASFRSFTLFAPNSFATMRMNEFLSNKYVSLYFTHDFGKLLTGRGKFQPEFALATNVGFGWLDFHKNHHGVDYQTMEKGFYESGLLVNNILDMMGLYSFGLGVFYRYGPYTFPDVVDNLGAKLTLTFGF
jgi:hypothetical protein